MGLKPIAIRHIKINYFYSITLTFKKLGCSLEV